MTPVSYRIKDGLCRPLVLPYVVNLVEQTCQRRVCGVSKKCQGVHGSVRTCQISVRYVSVMCQESVRGVSSACEWRVKGVSGISGAFQRRNWAVSGV